MTVRMVTDMDATDVQKELDGQLALPFPPAQPVLYRVTVTVGDHVVYVWQGITPDDKAEAQRVVAEQGERWVTVIERWDRTGWVGLFRDDDGVNHIARCIISTTPLEG